ncbi:hypothetical protein SRHO_G00193580 [Serrasalmus rhombeus]
MDSCWPPSACCSCLYRAVLSRLLFFLLLFLTPSHPNLCSAPPGLLLLSTDPPTGRRPDPPLTLACRQHVACCDLSTKAAVSA